MKSKYNLPLYIGSALTLLLVFSSCVSRLARPALSGYIYNYDNQPVVNCKVNETYTDNKGRFELKEIRYRRFLLLEIIALEAPALQYDLSISKQDYESYYHNWIFQHGGAGKKGALNNLDTLYIKRLNEDMRPERFLFSKWKFQASKNLDTLYGYNQDFKPTKISLNQTSPVKIWQLTQRTILKTPVTNSWNTTSYTLKTNYEVSLNKTRNFSGILTKQYIDPVRQRIKKGVILKEHFTLASDTIQTSGTFRLIDSKTLWFDKGFTGVETHYNIQWIDRDRMLLIRSEIKQKNM